MASGFYQSKGAARMSKGSQLESEPIPTFTLSNAHKVMQAATPMAKMAHEHKAGRLRATHQC